MMSEWRLPDEMVGRASHELDHPLTAEKVLRAAFGECDSCEGSGYVGPTLSGDDERLLFAKAPNHLVTEYIATAGEPCRACHGMGLAGVEWRCADDSDYPCKQAHPCTPDCRLALVIPLERSE